MAAPKSMRRLPDRHEADPRWLAEIEARFWPKVAKTDDLFGCWEWTAGKISSGYGAFGIRGVGTVKAHRVAWWLATGRWPGNLWVLHRCDNPGCVRPDHLFLGTCADNARDRDAKGRAGWQRHPELYARAVEARVARNRARTHCRHGHELTPENTVWRGRGGRECRECNRLAKRRDRAANLEAQRLREREYRTRNREIINARQNERRAADREPSRLRAREYRAANREQLIAKQRERYAANAEAMRLKAREYKARKRTAAGSEYLR